VPWVGSPEKYRADTGRILSSIRPSVGVMANHTTASRPANLVSIRIISDDVARLAEFYEQVTGTAVTWLTPDFVELATPAGTLAIGSTRTVALFSPGSARAADNHTAIIEFLVDDVDTEYVRIRKLSMDLSVDLSVDFVNEPTTMPWGNRSLLFRDPDGNLVNFFTPVTPEAKAKFGR
jgi:catechol 2,3-dioxygenase-like lactoylglutathione lyase family enzyme